MIDCHRNWLGLSFLHLLYLKAKEDKHMAGVVPIPDEKEDLSKDDDGSRYSS